MEMAFSGSQRAPLLSYTFPFLYQGLFLKYAKYFSQQIVGIFVALS